MPVASWDGDTLVIESVGFNDTTWLQFQGYFHSGTMKVTEQIDALRALAVYPTDYLVVPRALAMMVSMPLLVAECIAVGIAVGYLVAISLLEINGTYYMANMVKVLIE